METIGDYLKKTREERGLSIQQVAVKTRISPAYILALEENRLDQFPGEVFARGFVRVYGRCLGLDDPTTMTRFTQSAQSFFRERDEKKRSAVQSAEEEKVRKERRGRVLQIVIVVVLCLTVLTVYGINSRHFGGTEEADGPGLHPPSVPETAIPAEPHPELTEPAVNKPSLKEIEPARPGNALSPPAGPAAGPPKPTAAQKPPIVSTVKPEEKLPLIVNVPGKVPEPAAPVEGLVLVVEAVESSWVSARIDGGETKEVFLEPGEKVTWKAKDHFLISFGNAGGVKVQFNGKPLPPFGLKGAVVKDIKITRE
ncbi:MAG: helix-turn-helix domain-containing protein [Nitrospirae bacterium]|nr:helix-turn-helix domain-containing protein [Nitrospirota bacterium]